MNIDQIRKNISGEGYSYLKNFPEKDLLLLAYALGVPIPNKRDQKIIKEIRPESIEQANPNTLSSRYGIAAFPYHTETAFLREPVKYLILYCENPGAGKRPTNLLDFFTIPFSKIEKKVFSSEVWKTTQILRPFLTTIITENSKTRFVRFDMDCMLPVTTGEGQVILNHYIKEAVPISINWEAKDLLIVDNFRILHGRGNSNKPDPDRILKRVIVSI